MSASRLYGVELDAISGRIAQQLYPKANIVVRGYEHSAYPKDFFDAAVGKDAAPAHIAGEDLLLVGGRGAPLGLDGLQNPDGGDVGGVLGLGAAGSEIVIRDAEIGSCGGRPGWRASTLNAHFTPPVVIRAIYEALGRMGFVSGNILEPSMVPPLMPLDVIKAIRPPARTLSMALAKK